ncbi:MAG TPA: D-aminoacylase [Polyangia bacterium]
MFRLRSGFLAPLLVGLVATHANTVTALAADAQAAAAPTVDLLIRGGQIVDGTGKAAFIGDVTIKDGRVSEVAPKITTAATRTLEAKGLVVAPGFIDIHNHADNTLVSDGDAPSLLHQGVTSVILGEGGSVAPSKTYPTFKHYFDKLTGAGVAVNVGSFVGSSQIWLATRGERNGPPTRGELEKMRGLVKRAMNDGALGVSGSLSGPPGAWIDTDSLVAMCQVAAPFGGVYLTHLRHEGLDVFKAVDEALTIGRRADIPVEILHLKISEHSLWGKMPELIAKLEAARKGGARVAANVYPYRAGQNDLASIIPPWAHEGGTPSLIRRLKDPATRARIEAQITGGIPGWYNHYTATGSWEGMQVAQLSNPEYAPYVGKRMSDIIAALGGKPMDVLFRLLIDNNGRVPTVFFHHAEEDMRFALKQPFVSIGSDGGSLKPQGPLAAGHPHPRFYGTFPRVLGRYVRDEKVLTLEDAVRKMTSANATKLGLVDRGVLRPGAIADVTVFDPVTIIDKATFERPHQYSVGVVAVVVAGKLALDQGRPTGARAGQILRRPPRATTAAAP